MSRLDYQIFDADNHYYEATDAFTRHLDHKLARRAMQWVEIDGKRRLMVAGKLNRFIPNPTFDPVAKPGVLDDYFRGKRAGDDIRSAFGELDPISPAYRNRDARLALMDQQNMQGCLLFPTLGVGMEEALLHDPEAAHAAFHAFNEWLDEDWGFHYQERIFGAPYITLLDPERAVEEIDWAIGKGARVVVMRSGPVRSPSASRSPGDPVYDPFWAKVQEAGLTVAFHSGEAGYFRYVAEWGEKSEFEAFRHVPFRTITQGDRPVYDTVAALICHGVFHRFPGVRIATIENGSEWAPLLMKRLKKSYSQVPLSYMGNPIEQFQRQVWVAPYYEDDLVALRRAVGADHMLFGSDFPHAEGLADPVSFVDDLEGFSAEEIRLIMRENPLSLVTPAA